MFFLTEGSAGNQLIGCVTFDGILGHNIGVNISPLSWFHVMDLGMASFL